MKVIRALDCPTVYPSVAGLAVRRALAEGPMYVAEFSPDENEGRGQVRFTPNLSEALTFESAATALLFYMQTSTVAPFRDDGKPNRPLTAYTIAIEDAP